MRRPPSLSLSSLPLSSSQTGNKKWYDPTVYLSQASCKEDVMTQKVRARTAKVLSSAAQPAVQVSRSFREAVHISTLTCSTKLTQRSEERVGRVGEEEGGGGGRRRGGEGGASRAALLTPSPAVELLLLLKWRQKSGDLSVILKNVVHVGGEEMVKFLHNTLDCLFDILTENDEKYGELVFEALVRRGREGGGRGEGREGERERGREGERERGRGEGERVREGGGRDRAVTSPLPLQVAIFGLLSDDRYHHFTAVLDIYIEKHFSAVLAYK